MEGSRLRENVSVIKEGQINGYSRRLQLKVLICSPALSQIIGPEPIKKSLEVFKHFKVAQ